MTRRLNFLRDAIRHVREPLVLDSAMLFLTTVLMAAAGAAFWVIAARVHAPDVVGVAGSLISATVALAYCSQLGLNISLLDVLPHTDRQVPDIVASVAVVGTTGFALGWGYATAVGHLSPALAFLVASPTTPVLFGVLVSGAAVNLLTDSILLALRAVPANLAINGVVMGAVRCALPFALVGLGAFGLCVAVGVSSLLAAGLSLAAILWCVPRPLRWRGTSPRLRRSLSLSGASYLTTVVDMVPVLALPLVILHAQGAAANGIYYMCFQIATLLNAIVHAIGQSMYAEGSRRPERAAQITALAGRLMVIVAGSAVLVMLVASAWVLGVFGPAYATGGSATLQVLALGVSGVGFNIWSMVRLRLAHRLAVMLLAQMVAMVVILTAAVALAGFGIAWVAAAWGIGYLAGGLAGWLPMRRWAPVPDTGAVRRARPLTGVGDRR